MNVLPAAPPATGTATATPTATPTGGAASPSAEPSPTVTATVTPAPVTDVRQARGSLANTGAAHTGMITAAGGALVLLGAGLAFLARRRRLFPVGPTTGPGAGD